MEVPTLICSAAGRLPLKAEFRRWCGELREGAKVGNLHEAVRAYEERDEARIGTWKARAWT